MMCDQTSGFELRDHTADIALYAWGDSFAALFWAAANGLYATIGELKCAGPVRRDSLRFDAPDREGLLHDFLSELLYRFEVGGEVLADFQFDEFDSWHLVGSAAVAAVDRVGSVFDREVKAVTCHDLNIVEVGDRFEVTVVLDI